MLALAEQEPSIQIIAQPQFTAPDPLAWLHYFDPHAALQVLIDHVEALPGSRHERHTMRVYLGSMQRFVEALGGEVFHVKGEDYTWDFSGMRLPTPADITAYIADRKRAGTGSKTIARDLSPIRHFIRALESQPVALSNAQDFLYIMEAQRQLRLAVQIENPAPDTVSHRPALEQHGHRLTIGQVNKLFTAFEGQMHLLRAKRDLALLYLGFTSGLRAAEISRLTLANITQGKDCVEVRVRGKRNNVDPIGIDSTCFDLIQSYVNTWNERLATGPWYGDPDPNDPRRITGNTPVFRPLFHGDHIPYVGLNGFDPQCPMDPTALNKIVARHSQNVLGFRIGAHDMRRTMAYLMRSKGFEWDQIRDQLRHASIATTEHYVGREQNLAAALLGPRVRFILPADNEPTPSTPVEENR